MKARFWRPSPTPLDSTERLPKPPREALGSNAHVQQPHRPSLFGPGPRQIQTTREMGPIIGGEQPLGVINRGVDLFDEFLILRRVQGPAMVTQIPRTPHGSRSEQPRILVQIRRHVLPFRGPSRFGEGAFQSLPRENFNIQQLGIE